MDELCDKMAVINVTPCNLVANYEQLELLSESEPEKLFAFLINNNNFKYTLNKCVDITVLIHLMNIFSKVKLLQLSQIKSTALDMIYNSKYLEHLNNSLIDVAKLEDLISEIKLQEFFISCQSILEIIANPKSKELLNEIIQFIQPILIESSSTDIQELVLINDDSKTEKIVKNAVHYDVKRWPQCYKSLSIYPVITDITAKKVILSPNIMEGSYDNIEHYIDVQFRLLREDILAPMREGIQSYKIMSKLNQKCVIKMPNMRIYFEAKITKKYTEKETFLVHFFTKEDCSINSKRFMFESLLVFSDDNFNSMFFATVIKMNQQVSLPIKTLVIQPLGNKLSIKLNSSYTMAESDAYFLPYMYSMEVLKTFDHYNFPMKSYIVYGKTKPKVPAYLKYSSKTYNINGSQFDILNDKLWPDNKVLGLDCAQRLAFKAALTEEFTVIQGPPGTGKTYIGLRIAKSIIENMYETNILKKPIVVVCYTNHALDQFLEGLINITKKITRIGGGCKSVVLKSHVLGNINSPTAKLHLSKSYVVGLTTTGAAMRHSLLLELRPPIVIVEEAAEVLESHVVASLTESCQHLILIGDHQQLRPRNASYTLAKRFNFDVSLFERMVKNGFPCYTLATQHRMRPEISALMKPIYPFLMDHKSVKNRSDIRGVTKNIYFIHHTVNEEKEIGSNSHKNIHEAKFFMEFARYLTSQGYRQNQITILVTYRDQLLKFQKIQETSSFLEDFRVECVDGYQGEENDIVLLSLVRSNIDNKIGFLHIQNRICVALSRARDGLYIMGNMDNLIHSSIWKKISQTLVDQQALGNKLTLYCQIHKDWINTVCTSSDFSKVRCSKVCNIKMDCGHQCPHFCHYCDQSHKNLYCCKKDFTKILPCGFKIKIQCWMRFLTFECPL
ncbi:NFX1-type zinc finger-containing protein 1-like [Metopolophium dirhodum]|uniref:NFX1-type zinc finger-containing protein 1-like n=1 Tax=Metopolophium dirhodum TaxID=44670 RepID=UPI00298F8E04|nr:NFX1-type zinc finger-containing protein 1-like [Metopolophium dirhodum]XP_060861499.1 NFX1-type zinc finger-containing protein 1-like [Metopolophium dirhodum]XP_060861500.1 NFX1-type zinc finger-containing protein 1-like [Metopolophium dirhodum]